MKLITKIAAGAFVAIAFTAWLSDRTNPDGRNMENLHAAEGIHRMDCTESDYAGHRWMACRYPDQEQSGSLWAWNDNVFDEGAWIPRNGLAQRVTSSALEKAQRGQEMPGIGIAQLNMLDDENREWANSLPAGPWEHLK